MWKICFEDDAGVVVDTLEYDSYSKAKRNFDELFLTHYQKAVLIREDGTFLALKEKTVDSPSTRV